MSQISTRNLNFSVDISLSQPSQEPFPTFCLSPIFIRESSPVIPPLSIAFSNPLSFTKTQEAKRPSLIDFMDPVMKKVKPNIDSFSSSIPALKLSISNSSNQINFLSNKFESSQEPKPFETEKVPVDLLYLEKEEINKLSKVLKKKLMSRSKKKNNKIFDIKHVQKGKIVTENLSEDVTINQKLNNEPKKENKLSRENPIYTINENNELEEINFGNFPLNQLEKKMTYQLPPASSLKILPQLSQLTIPKFISPDKEDNELSLSTNVPSPDNLPRALELFKREFLEKQERQVQIPEFRSFNLSHVNKDQNSNDFSSSKAETNKFDLFESIKTNSISSTCDSESSSRIYNLLPPAELSAIVSFQHREQTKQQTKQKIDTKEEISSSLETFSFNYQETKTIKEESTIVKGETQVLETPSMEIEKSSQIEEIKSVKIRQKRIIEKKEKVKLTRDFARMRTSSSSRQKLKKNKFRKRSGKKFVSPWEKVSVRRKNRWQLVQSEGNQTEIIKVEQKLITKVTRQIKEKCDEIIETPVGSDHQIIVEAFKAKPEQNMKKRQVKMLWNPDCIAKKKLDLYFKKFEEVLGCELNQQKAIKVLIENNHDPKKVWKAVEGKEREYKKELEVNYRRRTLKFFE